MWRCPRYGRASADFTGPVQPTAGLLGATRWAVVDSGVVAKGRRFSDDDILEAIRAAAPPAGAAVDDAGLCGRPDAVIGRGRRWPRRPVASGAGTTARRTVRSEPAKAEGLELGERDVSPDLRVAALDPLLDLREERIDDPLPTLGPVNRATRPRRAWRPTPRRCDENSRRARRHHGTTRSGRTLRESS